MRWVELICSNNRVSRTDLLGLISLHVFVFMCLLGAIEEGKALMNIQENVLKNKGMK